MQKRFSPGVAFAETDAEIPVVEGLEVPHVNSERYLASCVQDLLTDCSRDEPEASVDDLEPMYDELEMQLSLLIRDRYPEAFSAKNEDDGEEDDERGWDDCSWVWQFEISDWMLDHAIAQMSAWSRLENSNIALDCRESPELLGFGDEEPRRIPREG